MVCVRPGIRPVTVSLYCAAEVVDEPDPPAEELLPPLEPTPQPIGKVKANKIPSASKSQFLRLRRIPRGKSIARAKPISFHGGRKRCDCWLRLNVAVAF